MNKVSLVSLLALLLAPIPHAHAGYLGSISFSGGERFAHEQAIDQIENTAAACLQRDLEHHQQFMRAHGFSPYYGDRGSFGKLSYAQKGDYLRRSGFDSRLLSQMQPISCVELMLNCLGEGFRAAGEANLWARIRSFTVNNGVDGMATQYALTQLGWKTLYWNPDTQMDAQWDAKERAHDPSNKDRDWGFHAEYWNSVQRSSRYLYNHVDDDRQLVNFGTRSPSFLRGIPFWVGIAHGGYHVFPGSYGEVVEAHSTRLITDPKSLQSASFNPLAGLGPTDGEYHSGLIAVPGKYFR
jgi:hypothetical protein